MNIASKRGHTVNQTHMACKNLKKCGVDGIGAIEDILSMLRLISSISWFTRWREAREVSRAPASSMLMSTSCCLSSSCRSTRFEVSSFSSVFFCVSSCGRERRGRTAHVCVCVRACVRACGSFPLGLLLTVREPLLEDGAA